MPTEKLTTDLVFAACSVGCPPEKRGFNFYDTQIPGFYLRVLKTYHVGTYYLRYTDAQGRTRHQHLGRTTDVSAAQARRRARAIRADIARGTRRRNIETH